MAKRPTTPVTAGFDFDAPAAAPAPAPVEQRDIYTPARLNREARMLIEHGFPALWLEGELSNYSRPSSGHWYFSLKDESAQLRCAMFRQRNLMAKFVPRDGLHVLARGRVSLYEPRGEYQFIVDHMEEAGEGALRRRFELLKAKLAAEGMFDTARKRTIPKCPVRIGVITSPTGAALRDVLNVLKRRYPGIPVLIYPVPVQGVEAPPKIAQMLGIASQRAECEVLILARGGGSLEDLWPFNEEIVARAISACSIPIVSGVGHEVDFTIADFVADLRAPTPSAAAELVAPDCTERSRAITLIARRLASTWSRRLAELKQRALWLERRLNLVHPGVWLRQQNQRVDELEQRGARALRHRLAGERSRIRELSAHLHRASPVLRLAHARGRLERSQADLESTMTRRLEQLRSEWVRLSGQLNMVSPLATLQRGYAIVTNAAGQVLTDVEQVQPGEGIEAKLANGRVHAVVERVERK
jgi:exodeoxyribonuclease VII large subunit